MDFDISNDQIAFNEQVERYLREQVSLARLKKAFDGDRAEASSIWKGILDYGLGGCLISPDHGGLGLGLLETAVLSELIGFAAAPGPWIGHILAGYAIEQAGSAEQRTRWAARLAKGEAIGTVALMEAGEWQPSKWRLAAENDCTGSKDYVLGVEDADIIVVALSDGKLGLVERDGRGVRGAAWPSTDRTRPVGRLTLDQATIEPMPTPFADELLNAALILVAADAHGGSRRVRDDITEYSKERVQFDRPIGSFQAVKHMLASMALNIEFNGAMYRQAAAIVQQKGEDASRAASTAKAHITDIFATSARTATESYGGIGYTWDHWAHIWLRRAMFNYAWLGSPSAHRRRAAELMAW